MAGRMKEQGFIEWRVVDKLCKDFEPTCNAAYGSR
mgnify:CR=1 FL=1